MKFHTHATAALLFTCSSFIPGVFANEACTLTIEKSNHNNGDIDEKNLILQANLSPDCDNAASITINLPDGNTKVFTKEVSEVPPFEDVAMYWFGEDLGDGSEFDFIRGVNGNMYGSLVNVSANNVIRIVPDANGDTMVTIKATSEFGDEEGEAYDEPEEEEEGPVGKLSGNLRGRRVVQTMIEELEEPSDNGLAIDVDTLPKINSINSHRKLMDDSGGNIDIMVVWTKRAECMNASDGRDSRCTLNSSTYNNMMVGVIEKSIMDTNMAYEASGIRTRLNLVHAYRHPIYEDTQSSHTNLERLRLDNDGHMDDVHSKRIQYGADLVALIADLVPRQCGRANLGATFHRAFSVTDYDCAVSNKSFAHEIGHNLGCLHDRDQANAWGKGGFNYGIKNVQNGFRSIMAYNCQGRSCPRVNKFSGPGVTHRGQNLGDSSHDNVRQINSVRAKVAGLVKHVSNSSGGSSAFRSYTNGQFPSECVDLKRSDTSNLNGISIFRCHGQSNQKWKFDSNGFLRSQTNEKKCMVAMGDGSNGSSIVIYDCDDRYTYMKWTRDNQGRFHLKSKSGQCLDVKNGTKDLHIWSCNDSADKIWKVSS